MYKSPNSLNLSKSYKYSNLSSPRKRSKGDSHSLQAWAMLNLLPFQIVHSHIPPNGNPPPPEPDHLTLMPLHHSRLRGQPLPNRTNKQQPRRTHLRTPLFPAKQIPQHAQHHRPRRIQHTDILAQHRRRRQRIQRHGTRKTLFIHHQRAQEMHRAMI